ncbi:MAG TPA: PAS domain S-box protein [Desulfopila sp.]|nr:PAS domain S-box protein [Desulfopila sp.]
MTDLRKEFENHRFFQDVFSATQDFLSVIDREYRYVLVNDAYLKLYNMKREDIIGRRVDELFDADVFETSIKKHLNDCLQGNTISYRKWFDLAEMGRRCMHISYSPYRDEQGNIVGVVASGRDLTELTLALEEKKRTERRLEMMARAGNIGLWDWNLESNELYLSPEWKSQLGYANHEISNEYLEWEKRLHPEDRAEAVGKVQKYIKKPWADYTNEFRMLHKDGSYRWIMATASLLVDDDQKRPVRMMGAHIDVTGQKEREEILKKTEEISTIAQRAGKIGYWWYDPVTRCPEWTEEVFRIFGLDPDAHAPSLEDHKRYLHPDDWELLDSLLSRAGELGIRYDVDLRITAANGERKFIHSICEPHTDEQGRVIELVGTVQDITIRKKAIEAAEESKKQYRDLFDSIRDLILVADRERTIIDCNQAFLDTFGYAREEMLGRKTQQLYENEEMFREMGEKLKKHVHEASFLTTVRYMKKSGECFPGETSVYFLKDDSGQVYGIIGLIRDVSERLEVEERVKKSEAQFRTLVESLFDAIVVIKTGGETLFVNEAACELFGRSKDELVGRSFGFPITNNTSQEIDIIHKSGQRRFAEIKTSLADWGGEKVILASIRDTTENVLARQEREQYMERIEQAQRLESIGTLAGGIAHDFNNILTPIMGFSEILRELVKGDEDASECIAEVYQSAMRARELVGQILAFSRQTKSSYRPITIEPIIKEVLKLLRSGIPSTISIEQDIQSKGMIHGDETEIHQILMNLCTNAMHAMEGEGGVLSVSFHSVEFEESDTASYTDLKPGKYIHLQIRDTGCGMEPDIAKKIFEPYFTTKEKEKGTGLGLSVVHGIIHNHDGVITVDSEVGKGTVFDIYLPQSIGKSTVEDEDIVEVEGGKEHILVVDDEPAVLRLNTKVLEKLGYRVTTRVSSIEALALFENRYRDFDLLFSDMTMPEMTGYVLAKKCLAIQPDLPVILATGFSERINQEEAAQIGVRTLLKKPLTRAELAKALRAVLDGRDPLEEDENINQ